MGCVQKIDWRVARPPETDVRDTRGHRGGERGDRMDRFQVKSSAQLAVKYAAFYVPL